jgi:hypothetical protein
MTSLININVKLVSKTNMTFYHNSDCWLQPAVAVVIISVPLWKGLSAIENGVMDMMLCLLDLTRAWLNLFYTGPAMMLAGNI